MNMTAQAAELLPPDPEPSVNGATDEGKEVAEGQPAVVMDPPMDSSEDEAGDPEEPFDRAKAEYDALAAARLLPELTDESILAVHDVLSLLLSEMKQDWDSVMTETLTEQEKRLACISIQERQAAFRVGPPLGAVPMSTEALRVRGEISEADMRLAIQVLKSTGRLVQCGRGRGKCLVVLSDVPVSMDLIKAQRLLAAQEAATELDAVDLLKAALDRMKMEKKRQAEEVARIKKEAGLKAQAKVDLAKIKELSTELRAAQQDAADLRKAVAAKDRAIEQLERELRERLLSSWS